MNVVACKFEPINGGCSNTPGNHIEQPIEQPLGNQEYWLSVAELVVLSEVSPQMVKKAIGAKRWRGADLIVRQAKIGRGGAGGKVPQVHVDSLPADLKKSWYLERGIDLHEQVSLTRDMTVLCTKGTVRF